MARAMASRPDSTSLLLALVLAVTDLASGIHIPDYYEDEIVDDGQVQGSLRTEHGEGAEAKEAKSAGAAAPGAATKADVVSAGAADLLEFVKQTRAQASPEDWLAHKTSPGWDYRDMRGWMHVQSSMCDHSGDQSPINIKESCVNYDNILTPINYTFQSSGYEVQPETNARTWEMIVADGQASVVLDGKDYHLAQFHFHSPSENTIDDKFYPMEAQMVHKSADGHVLVVSQMLDVSDSENSFLDRFWSALPADIGKATAHEGSNPYTKLLSADSAYFRWLGSFTTPPCTNDIEWILKRTPVHMSQRQLDAYRNGINSVHHNQLVVKAGIPAGITANWKTDLGVNNRPVQPLGQRVVQGYDNAKNTPPLPQCAPEQATPLPTPTPTPAPIYYFEAVPTPEETGLRAGVGVIEPRPGAPLRARAGMPLPTSPLAGHAPGHLAFDYEDQTSWHNLGSCSGTAQSPIDILNSAVKSLKANGMSTQLQYTTSSIPSLVLYNTGHSHRLNAELGNFTPYDDAQPFKAAQFHFHFPSENAIDGFLADGEMQIVHTRQDLEEETQYAVISMHLVDRKRFAHPMPHHLKQIGFFYKIGLTKELPVNAGDQKLVTGYLPNFMEVFQEVLAGSYYRWTGSLTTPPCTEGVRWFLMKEPVAITSEIIDKSRKVFPIGNNRRPQALNGRQVVLVH